VVAGGAELRIKYDNGSEGTMSLAEVKGLCSLAEAHEE
jgi:hypothetical protein